MNNDVGQRLLSTLVDLAFFAVVALFGVKKIISEVLIGTLLSGYAASRFGVAMSKQQARTMSNMMSGGGGGTAPPPSGGITSSGISGRFRQVNLPPETPQRDPSTIPRTSKKERISVRIPLLANIISR